MLVAICDQIGSARPAAGLGVQPFWRTYVRMHARTRARTLARTRARTHARTRTRTHARMHTRMHACTHALTHARTHALTHSLTHSLTHARTHARTHSLMHSRTHARTYARTHARTHSGLLCNQILGQAPAMALQRNGSVNPWFQVSGRPTNLEAVARGHQQGTFFCFLVFSRCLVSFCKGVIL